MTFVLALFLATAFPSNSRTSWMSPEAFRLAIGMRRADAVKTLEESGWALKPGKKQNELVLDYGDEKSLTLDFHRERLRSVRFELFGFLAHVRAAFDEQKTLLKQAHGEPKKGGRSSSVVVYDDRLPSIIVVLSADPKSEYGQKGIGFLAVRYYDPVR